jgi:hypothetical protein
MLTPVRSPLARTTSFKKGTPKPSNSGRRKGAHNKTTMALREAALVAAGLCGQDGKGKGELIGYMRMLAREQPAVFARLLVKILPMQSTAEIDGTKRYTPAEAAARLRERGLPVPQALHKSAGEKLPGSGGR